MDVIFEDKDILVINKPAGLPVQTARVGEKDLESECKKYLKAKGELPEIYLVHRLDQPVSGIMVLAKNNMAAGKLGKSIKDGDFSKDYKARVLKEDGFVKEGTLEDYLVKDSKSNSSRIAKSARETGAVKAELSYFTSDEDEETAELTIALKTGRHHQIRVQLSNAGMPILGDRKYGNERSLEISADRKIKNVALRAYKLSFVHPVTGAQMEFCID